MVDFFLIAGDRGSYHRFLVSAFTIFLFRNEDEDAFVASTFWGKFFFLLFTRRLKISKRLPV